MMMNFMGSKTKHNKNGSNNYPGEVTPPGGYLHRTCPSRGSGRVNVPKRQ